MLKMLEPPHPGIVLKEEYLQPLNLTVTETAKRLNVGRQTISKILNGRSGISAEMSYRLSKLLATSPELWINMQTAYDRAQAKNNVDLSTIEPVLKAS